MKTNVIVCNICKTWSEDLGGVNNSWGLKMNNFSKTFIIILLLSICLVLLMRVWSFYGIICTGVTAGYFIPKGENIVISLGLTNNSWPPSCPSVGLCSVLPQSICFSILNSQTGENGSIIQRIPNVLGICAPELTSTSNSAVWQLTVFVSKKTQQAKLIICLPGWD